MLIRRTSGRRVTLGPMFEEFVGLCSPRSGPGLVLAREPQVVMYAGAPGPSGWWSFDVIQIRDGAGQIVAAASGELSLSAQVFIEHHAYTQPRARNAGWMRQLYTVLLEQDIVIVSDDECHSPPMRGVWARLARTWNVYSVEGKRCNGTDPENPAWDDRLCAFPNAAWTPASVVAALGASDWSGLYVPHEQRLGWRGQK